MHIHSTNRTTNFKSVIPIRKAMVELPNGIYQEISDPKVISNLTIALVRRLNDVAENMETDTIRKIAPDFRFDQRAASTFIGNNSEQVHRFLMLADDARRASVNNYYYGVGDITKGTRHANIEAEIIAPLSKRIKNADGDTLSLTLLAEKKGSKIKLTGIEVVNDNAPKVVENNFKPIKKVLDDTDDLFPDLKPDPPISYGNE